MITNAQNPETLSGARKAAVLVVLIGDAASAEPVKQPRHAGIRARTGFLVDGERHRLA